MSLKPSVIAMLIVCLATFAFPMEVAAEAQPFRVLILGDSYSSGNGTRSGYEGPRDCWRSTKTWGAILGSQVETAIARPVSVTNRACSGAVTKDLIGGTPLNPVLQDRKLDTRDFYENSFFEIDAALAAEKASKFCASLAGATPDEYWSGGLGPDVTAAVFGIRHPRCSRFLMAQVTQVDQSYDLVVLTIGGNDGGFADIAAHCLTSQLIPGSAILRDGRLCRRAIEAAQKLLSSTDSGAFRSRIQRVMDGINARLNPANRTSQGRTLLLSYPNLIKNSYGFENIDVSGQLAQLQSRTDAIQREVMSLYNPVSAAQCAFKRSLFGDLTKILFDEHELVAPVGFSEQIESWLWELRLDPMTDAFHPKPAGHVAEANAAFESVVAGGLEGCPTSDTLILNRDDNGIEGRNLELSLAGLGDNVYRSSSLPADGLNMYKAIWVVIAYSGLSGDEISRLSEYVRNGGSLYLTGERPCCEVINGSSQAIIRGVSSDADVQVGRLGDVAGPYLPNPNAAGNAAVSPQRLTEFTPDAPGGMASIGNIAGRNVLISNGEIPVAAVWDEQDMVSHRGRIAILMDVDWLKQPNRSQYVINIHEFLIRT